MARCPVADGIVISLARMTRILEVDVDRGEVVVEPGVTNLDVTRAVAAAGFYYAPDPSSQQVCTIGGNVAENSGGAHCLKYGFTVNHVLAAEVVLPDGELVELSVWDDGPDLLGAFVGSEGTLGIATKLTLRILRAPEAVRTLLAGFGHTDEAGARGLGRDRGRDPARGDRDDGRDHDRGGGGGGRRELPERLRRRRSSSSSTVPPRRSRRTSRASRRSAASPSRARSASRPIPPTASRCGAAARPRSRRWAGSAPTTTCRTASSRGRSCRASCAGSTTLSQEHGLRVGNVFHAGDGNLHPLVLYDGAIEGQAARAEELAQQILDACVDAGGSITGEHGVGTDKACAMPLMFGEDDLAVMQRLRRGVRPATGSRTPASSSRRRGCAARCPAPIASIRSRRRGLPTGSDGSSSTSPAT